jgi:undecaprenyl pyrophosphate phosphatase UppP
MSYTRIAMQVVGAAFVLVALGVLYYQTPLRNDIPEGVAVATLLAITGLFVIAFAEQFRTTRRIHDVEHQRVSRTYVERPSRPLRGARDREEPSDVESHERVETIERRL